MSNLVTLKWRPFQYKAKFEKSPLLLRSEMGIFDIFFKDCTTKVLKIYRSIVIENFIPVPLCPIKWRPFKVLVKLHKTPILIPSIVKGAVAGLRQVFATESP